MENDKITLKEILIGDVWFCSGQSNMVHQMGIHDVRYAKDVAEANYPEIRQFWISTLTNLQRPQNDLPTGYWKWANPEDVRLFSAVAYFFARKLYEKYHVPIGLINASVGGTPIEAWTSEEGLKEFPSLQATIQKNKDTAYVNGLARNFFNANGNRSPQVMDKGMTDPVKWFDPAYVPAGMPSTFPAGGKTRSTRSQWRVWYRKK
jgi:sialate O-acetylesterase